MLIRAVDLSRSHDSLLDALQRAIGAARVSTDSAALAVASHDVFFTGVTPACVVRPADKAQVAAIMVCAAEHGYAVHPRGGGMSYTAGYLPSGARSIALDLRDLAAILAIDEENLLVTVQPAVTWRALYDALRARGLRVPVFGTMSGSVATVGGGLSQGSIFYGSGLYGTSADMVLGLEVVLPSGATLCTGAGAVGGRHPFLRQYGPDLSGPFLSDCGAFGIKVEATLRLMAWPEHVGCASFAFADFESLHAAQSTVARAGLAAESYVFDAILQHQLMERTSLLQDSKSLARLLGHQGGVLRNLKDAVSIAASGKRFLDGVPYSLHLVIESRHAAGMRAALEEARHLAAAAGGRPLPDTIPRMSRVEPFASMDMTLGPAGERWVPTHGFVRMSDAVAAMRRVQALLGAHRARLSEQNILVGVLGSTVAPAAYVIEALFYWPDRPSPLHRSVLSAAKLAAGDQYPDNPAARALVSELRAALVDVFAEFGGGHFGIGRSIPYARGCDPGALDVLRSLKQVLDPSSIANPGALGLP